MKGLVKFIGITTTLCVVMYLAGQQAGIIIDMYYNARSSIQVEAGNRNVVYLAGSLCTVNMTADRDVTEINKDFIWCMEQHLNHLAQEKK